ncbi:MAG: isoamylase early set domain-containing protein, partial [Candidatus Krumholzibacteria bacterium]|nr:isoamylase early set domain-containing protein [Candidatus Krumholzibacteria bacterium]
PSGAIDYKGSVLPERLFGSKPDLCFLLYTVIDVPSRIKLIWKLETPNSSSLWINGDPMVSSDEWKKESLAGSIELRKGLNSFLIASCWKDAPGGVLFNFSDENGLPASGISNEIDKIIEGFDRLASTGAMQKHESQTADHLREVLLNLDRPDAFEVCIIGSFNNWEPDSTPMKKNEDGLWTVSIFLTPGRYPYKFLINRKIKIIDPHSMITEPDGFGGVNSILVVR